jgi:excinuclease ABC subunit A
VLAAGPHAERPRFDPQAAVLRELEEAKAAQARDKALGAAEARLPWEADGRAWHTRDRVTRTGKPCRWDGALLDLVVDALEAIPGLPPIQWNQRTIVRSGPLRGFPPTEIPPFFEATTGSEWVCTLRFRVRVGPGFDPPTLSRELGLLPFHELPTPVASDLPRVRISTVQGRFREITLQCHSRAELETPAFLAFLRRAAESYLGPDGESLPVSIDPDALPAGSWARSIALTAALLTATKPRKKRG